MCSFRAGNFDFIAMAQHTRWGDGTPGRERELRALADWIKDRFDKRWAEDRDLIVGGDFNVSGDKLYQALTSQGLKQPRSLARLTAGDKVLKGTNLEKSARYDQILYLPTMDDRRTLAGGTLDFFVDDAHIEELYPGKKLTRQAFSFQLSDHLPLWVQLDTDIDGWRLDQIVQAGGKG